MSEPALNSTSPPLAIPKREARQLEIFPRRAKIENPPTGGTVESIGLVYADDSAWYHVKPDCDGKPTRANEWISYILAERIALTVPTPSVVELKSGECVFGSRKLSAVDDEAATLALLTTRSILPGLGVSELGKLLSGIYAFDLCIQNHDRHLKNYLTISEGNKRTLFAVDFGRAIFWDWPWAGFPPPNSNTRIAGKLIRGFHGFDLLSATRVLDRLLLVIKSDATMILNSVPGPWLADILRDQLYEYWVGGSMDQRIAFLKGGLADASLL